MKERVILHCDCNSFFASVETVFHPEYRGVPMAVCGSQEDRHGIVLAKNEEAKAYGIKTAETVYSAKQKCPHLIVAEPHYSLYHEYSKKANEIYQRYTDMVEPFGIDESWLDVTASRKLFGGGMDIAKKISADIKRELGITVSIGVSFNKVFAKLGSDLKKPDAITEISRENFKKIVFPLPVSDLLFVGRRTAEELSHLGVKTIGDLAEMTREMLISKFGKAGDMLFRYSNGLDDSPVSPDSAEDAKSISNGFTFKHDLYGVEQWKIALNFLSDEIGTKLRERGLKCSTVQITIKDEYLRSVQRQRPMNPPSDIASEIAALALKILADEWSPNRPIRMLTVSCVNLLKKEQCTSQISIFEDFDEKREKRKKSEDAVDIIRQKFGSNSIVKGAVIDSDLGIYKAPSQKND